MFTGIVESLAQVAHVEEQPPGRRLRLALPGIAGELHLGDSVAINGCCLTVVAVEGELVDFEAGPETLSKTNLGRLAAGSQVNIERALRVGDRLGGHYVTGHVDTVGNLFSRNDDPPWATLWFALPPALTRQIVPKGSIAVDGVSLTVVDVTENRFSVQLIPHTLAVTTLGNLVVGDPVNLETDILAKYAQKATLPAADAALPATDNS